MSTQSTRRVVGMTGIVTEDAIATVVATVIATVTVTEGSEAALATAIVMTGEKVVVEAAGVVAAADGLKKLLQSQLDRHPMSGEL
mmetsp:Transcript_1055/g.2348  ORF Transcript_1055/g.2348 Transcript_1055/m.2348 type:complete len:85 (+) Transcript_1055:491-745(+)